MPGGSRKLTMHDCASRANRPFLTRTTSQLVIQIAVNESDAARSTKTVGWVVGSRSLQVGKCARRHGILPIRRKKGENFNEKEQAV